MEEKRAMRAMRETGETEATKKTEETRETEETVRIGATEKIQNKKKIMKIIARDYTKKEEFWNVLTHGFGLAISIPTLALLVIYTSLYKDVWHIVSFSVYGGSLIILYLASTLYHSSKAPKIRQRLNIFDHAAIYVLIAGTYTPYTLVTLNGTMGWVVFGIVWGAALIGVVLKGRMLNSSSIVLTAPSGPPS